MDERATLTLELPSVADGWTVDDLVQIADGGDLHLDLRLERTMPLSKLEQE